MTADVDNKRLIDIWERADRHLLIPYTDAWYLINLVNRLRAEKDTDKLRRLAAEIMDYSIKAVDGKCVISEQGMKQLAQIAGKYLCTVDNKEI